MEIVSKLFSIWAMIVVIQSEHTLHMWRVQNCDPIWIIICHDKATRI